MKKNAVKKKILLREATAKMFYSLLSHGFKVRFSYTMREVYSFTSSCGRSALNDNYHQNSEKAPEIPPAH